LFWNNVDETSQKNIELGTKKFSESQDSYA